MKEQNLSDVDKILLRKRALIESVNDELKTSVALSIPDIDLYKASSTICCLAYVLIISYLRNHRLNLSK